MATFEITPEAQQTLGRMRDRCMSINAMFGGDHEYAVEADRSLRAALTNLLGWSGHTRVMQDGDLSLICVNEATGFVFGINWSRKFPLPEQYRGLTTIPEDFVGSWSVNS